MTQQGGRGGGRQRRATMTEQGVMAERRCRSRGTTAEQDVDDRARGDGRGTMTELADDEREG